MIKEKVTAIIAAAGIGKRMNTGKCKQMIELANRPILHYSISAFERCDSVTEIVIVTNSDIIEEVKTLARKYNYKKISNIILGGKERQDSIKNAVDSIKSNPPSLVLVHDAVRPFIKVSFIETLIKASKTNPCVIPAIKLKDTIKYTTDGKYFENTIDRSNYRLIQTPQVFHFDLLCKAYENAYLTNYYGTDDSSLVEKLGIKPMIFEGYEENFKITTPNDLQYAGFLINEFKH